MCHPSFCPSVIYVHQSIPPSTIYSSVLLQVILQSSVCTHIHPFIHQCIHLAISFYLLVQWICLLAHAKHCSKAQGVVANESPTDLCAPLEGEINIKHNNSIARMVRAPKMCYGRLPEQRSRRGSPWTCCRYRKCTLLSPGSGDFVVGDS